MLLYVKLICMLILFLISNFGSCQLGMKIERDRKVIDRIIHPFAPRPATPTGTGHRPHLFGEEGETAPETGTSGPTTTTDKTSGLPVPNLNAGPQPTLAPPRPRKAITFVYPDGSQEKRVPTDEEQRQLDPMTDAEFKLFQAILRSSNTQTNWKVTVGPPRKIPNSWDAYLNSD